MGRGLSELQKTILVTAYDYHESEGGCSAAHILVRHFGWTPPHPPDKSDDQARLGVLDGHAPHKWHVFSKTDIGEVEYNRAMASLSRSIKRLISRGLLMRYFDSNVYKIVWWKFLTLTESGLEAAKQLTVKQKNLETQT